MHTIHSENYIKERLGGKEPIQIQFINDLFKSDIKFYCAGGAIRDIFDNKNSFTDIDIFPVSEDCFASLVKYINEKYRILSSKENDYNISIELGFLDNEDQEEHKFKVQIIKIFSENLEDLLNSFDFTICQFGYDPYKKLFVFGDMSIMDLCNRKLVITKVSYPLSTLRRFFKYNNKGFYACSGSLKNFLKQVRSHEDSDIDKEPEYID